MPPVFSYRLNSFLPYQSTSRQRLQKAYRHLHLKRREVDRLIASHLEQAWQELPKRLQVAGRSVFYIKSKTPPCFQSGVNFYEIVKSTTISFANEIPFTNLEFIN